MNMLDLFSGIGGFHLAAEWVWGADLNVVAHVEIDDFCQRVLRKHWPETPIISDIREYKHDGTNVFLLTGGFPCQDISVGNVTGEGVQGDRSGLWFKMCEIISEVRPEYCIVENVSNLLKRGAGEVFGSLVEIGYDCEWHCIPASFVGAPHIRDRIWIVAYPRRKHGKPWVSKSIQDSGWLNYSHGYRKRLRNGLSWNKEITPDYPRMVNGLSYKLYRDRLRSLGNSIVPQVVVPIMQAIKES